MRPGFEIFAEDWAPTREPPAVFELDGSAAVRPVEADGWAAITPGPPAGGAPLAFVDGTRRVEMGLWQLDPDCGRAIRGIAGAFAVGATVCRPGVPAAFAGLRRSRVCVWAGGLVGDLGPVAGFSWEGHSIAAPDADAPLAALQDLMRDAEGDLAGELAERAWQVVLDGPLNHLRSLRTTVAGYVKTHHRQLLPDDLHRRVPELAVGQRSPLWALGDERYTCYARVGRPTSVGSPWSGIIRLELPAAGGVDAALATAGRLAGALPRYAGRPHLDPRAPQNLQPVRALEMQLSRLLGSPRLAAQSARSAIAHLRARTPVTAR